MNNGDIDSYLTLIRLALPLGADLVSAIKNHAQGKLTAEEYAQLETAFAADAAEAKANMDSAAALDALRD